MMNCASPKRQRAVADLGVEEDLTDREPARLSQTRVLPFKGVTVADRIAPPRPGTGGLLVLTGLVERAHQLCTAVAGHPHEGGLDRGIEFPAAPRCSWRKASRAASSSGMSDVLLGGCLVVFRIALLR